MRGKGLPRPAVTLGAALDLAARLGLLAAEVHAAARERLAAEPDGETDAATLSALAGLPEPLCDGLLRVARALHERLALPDGAGEDPAAETLRVAGALPRGAGGDAAEETLRIARGPSASVGSVGEAALAAAMLSPTVGGQGSSAAPDVPEGPPGPDAPTVRLGEPAVAALPGRPLPPDAPRRLGPFVLLSELGHGGMGAVYLAEETGLARRVALKVMLPRFADEPDAVERFYREARACAGLSHPHVVSVLGVGEEDGTHYYAMEYVEGRSAAEVIRREPLSQERAARLVLQAARGLAHAHEGGVVHRDVKPQNLMVAWRRVERPDDLPARERAAVAQATATHAQQTGPPVAVDAQPTVAQPYEDLVKVADFGLARVAGSQTLTQTGAGMGTPLYMSPEQFVSARDVGPTSDVWSLGATLYEMLTGRPPFWGEDPYAIQRRGEREEAVPPRRLVRTVDRDLQGVTLKCLEKEPHRRYADAGGLADDLARWLRGEAVRARRTGPVGRAARWVRRNPLLSAAAAAVLVALFGGIGLSEWKASSQRNAECESLVREAEECIHEAKAHSSPLPSERVAAIKALVEADEKLRSAQDLMAGHGGGPAATRYDVNRQIGEKALAGNDWTLARVAYSACRSLDARRAEADGLVDARVDEAEQREAQRRKGRIEAALSDFAAGLGRPGREDGAPDLDDYVFEVSGYRDEQTVRLLREALRPFVTKAERGGKDAEWTQEERQKMTFVLRVLGRLGLDSAVEPLAGMMGVLWDHELAVECGTALCNTRSASTTRPLIAARDRLGMNSSTWGAIEHSFARVPSIECDAEPQTAAAFNERGLVRKARGDVEGAIRDFARAIELDPKDASALNNRGNARKDKGDMEGAIGDYARAIELDAKNAAAFTGRGAARANRGDVEGAIGDHTRAIELDPKYAKAFNNRGVARAAKGDAEGAIEDYTRAIELDPKYAAAFYNRGIARAAKGDVEAGVVDYDAALRLNPRCWEVYANKGLALEASGKPTRAVDCYERALAIVGDKYAPLKEWLARARAAVASGETAPWAAKLRDADAAVQRGDYAAARPMYEEALAQAPANPDAAMKALLRDARYNLACILSLASAGKDGPKAEAKLIAAGDASRLRERAFRELRAAIDLGYADAKRLSEDPDLAPLHDDPSWAEILQRLRR